MVKKKLVLVGFVLLLNVISLAACQGTPGPSPEFDQEGEVSSPLVEEEVPEINLPTIDGIIDSQEWENAAIQHFEEGSEVYFMVSGDDLYVAIRNIEGGMIAGNVFLEQEGRVSVLHTSAALGTAVYMNEGEAYRKIKDFEWCCRSKLDDEVSRTERDKFYNEESWLGQNSFIGIENELEYKISLEGTLSRLAVNFILADGGGEKLVWPVGLEDGVAQPTEGGFPDLIEFSIEEWIPLEENQ